MKVVVTGLVATYPLGGVAWDYLQYVLGLEQLGCEVWYLEDSGLWGYDPVANDADPAGKFGVAFLRSAIAEMCPSLADRWVYRAPDGRDHGPCAGSADEVLAEADVFLNVSGACVLRPEYVGHRCKVLIDTDPGWNQLVGFDVADRSAALHGLAPFRTHDHFFTYAERMGRTGCGVPDLGIAWQSTRPPVSLDHWSSQPPARDWTTVMTWRANYRGVDGLVKLAPSNLGGKEHEINHILDLPHMVPAPYTMAISGPEPPLDLLTAGGWSVLDAVAVSKTPDSYRDFVAGSRGEVSVAKQAYVTTASGWFSCRSTCYLASGRPVVVQDTGFSEVIPCGDGILAFTDSKGAAAGVRAVEAEYEHHARSARELAREHFAADVVLSDLLGRLAV